MYVCVLQERHVPEEIEHAGVPGDHQNESGHERKNHAYNDPAEPIHDAPDTHNLEALLISIILRISQGELTCLSLSSFSLTISLSMIVKERRGPKTKK